jgi:signal transduction histidine kinase
MAEEPTDLPLHRRDDEAARELDAIATALAHDLRAPLRAIDGFSRILLANHA